MRDQFKLNFIDLPLNCEQIIQELDQDLTQSLQQDSNGESRRVWRRRIELDAELGQLLQQANEDFYGFELNDHVECNFARYDVGDHYQAQHMDCMPGHADQRKLSWSLMLNHNYEGGVFGTQHEQIGTVTGRLLVFPSYLLHSVTPVTAGVRYVIYGFWSGPHWR